MSAIIFDSFKGLYNYYYDVGKDWTSCNHAMPEKDYKCLVRVQKYQSEPMIKEGSFTTDGWKYHSGQKIEPAHTVTEWRYDTQSKCEIL